MELWLKINTVFTLNKNKMMRKAAIKRLTNPFGCDNGMERILF
jgi:hypothetical protein